MLAIPGFPGRVLGPGTEGYHAARAVWNVMHDREPALIAQCTRPQDVAAALIRPRARCRASAGASGRVGGSQREGACVAEPGGRDGHGRARERGDILAHELADPGVRIQVVCPGVVRSEFHSRQGMDMSEVPRMEADDVVKASLADLADGVLVSVPGLADAEALARLDAAHQALASVARTKELPARYADSSV